MVNQMIFVRVLAFIAFVGTAVLLLGPIHILPGWTGGIVCGICGGMIAAWVQAEWRNSQEDDDNES
jgi:hypothetical protein